MLEQPVYTFNFHAGMERIAMPDDIVLNFLPIKFVFFTWCTRTFKLFRDTYANERCYYKWFLQSLSTIILIFREYSVIKEQCIRCYSNPHDLPLKKNIVIFSQFIGLHCWPLIYSYFLAHERGREEVRENRSFSRKSWQSLKDRTILSVRSVASFPRLDEMHCKFYCLLEMQEITCK